MGLLVAGQWVDQWYDTKKTQGKFVRQESSFRDVVGTHKFPAVANRYHLYVSHACPWAHRAVIVRKLKDLESIITMSVVEPFMGQQGWVFGANGDPVCQLAYLHQLYTTAQPNYTGRVTVPVLWDKQEQTIVNNESSEIIRMLNTAFDALTGNKIDFYPEALRAEIDEINHFVYHRINNGVYKAGFATEQSVYDQEVTTLFSALDQLEQRLATQRYLVGDILTEADIRLFTTLVRFDPVYVGHFKCNLQRIADYPNLFGYLKDIYQYTGIADTVHIDHIKAHYYQSHLTINPTQIVPKGPELHLSGPHQRTQLNNRAADDQSN